MRKRVEPSTCFPPRVWRATVLLRPTRATINPLMALSLRSNPSLHPSLFAPLVSPTLSSRSHQNSERHIFLCFPLSTPNVRPLSPSGWSRVAILSFRSTSRSSPLLHRPLSSVHLSRAASLHPFLREQLHPPCLSLYRRLSYSLTSGHLLGYLLLPANLSFSPSHSPLLFSSLLFRSLLVSRSFPIILCPRSFSPTRYVFISLCRLSSSTIPMFRVVRLFSGVRSTNLPSSVLRSFLSSFSSALPPCSRCLDPRRPVSATSLRSPSRSL